MDATLILAIGAWLSVWILFALFIRHIWLSKDRHRRIQRVLAELRTLQAQKANEQVKFHSDIRALVVGIKANLDTLRHVNMESVTEAINKAVDERLKHITQ